MVPNDGYLKGVRYNVVFRVLYVQLTSALISFLSLPTFTHILGLSHLQHCLHPQVISTILLRRAVLILGSCAQSTMSFGLQMR